MRLFFFFANKAVILNYTWKFPPDYDVPGLVPFSEITRYDTAIGRATLQKVEGTFSQRNLLQQD